MTTLLHEADVREDERAWLVGYCARLCGDPVQAEDLAQETLLAAWQGADRRPEAVAPRAWLAGIARHMVQRWARRRAQEQRRIVVLEDDDPALAVDALATDLDRHELATLLDRALALLPPPTRAALIAHYIDEAPQAEIAGRLGLSEGALAVRLHRGRLTMARMLARDGGDLVRNFGILPTGDPAWEATPLWCTFCGRHHLEGRFDATHSTLRLRCPDCGELVNHGVAVRGAKTFGAAFNRVIRWCADYYLPGATQGSVACPMCGWSAPLGIEHTPTAAGPMPTLAAHCTCDIVNTCELPFLAQITPAGQAFARAHARMRLEDIAETETAYGATTLVTFASVTTADRFTVRFATATLRPLP
jgi:RNA polymerase sigma factor (sigma-70 family)